MSDKGISRAVAEGLLFSTGGWLAAHSALDYATARSEANQDREECRFVTEPTLCGVRHRRRPAGTARVACVIVDNVSTLREP